MIVALMFSWLVVLLDCEGGPEAVDRYELAWARRDVAAVVACPTDEDPGAMCTVYTDFAPIVVGEVPQPEQPFDGQRIGSHMPDCDASPGGVCYWIVTAIDAVGLRDDPTCLAVGA